MPPIRLLVLDPGHFHAALVLKAPLPGLDSHVRVYGPDGPDLTAFVERIAAFNARPEQPTAWQLQVYTGSDFLERLLRERAGDVVVLAGRNRRKIDYLEACVGAGFHVLADKPWIIRAEDLPRLQAVLESARARGLIAYDLMTERWEITSILQRELIAAEGIFGSVVDGSAEAPAVVMASVHYLRKQVAGVPLRRPGWFFDIEQQGEGLSDVGTHLVDLVNWLLFPNQAIDVEQDIVIDHAERWPTVVSREAYQQITGEADFPTNWKARLQAGRLPYFCNNRVCYRLRGHWVSLDIRWEVEAPPGQADTHHAAIRGTRSIIRVCQGAEEAFRPELDVLPSAASRAEVHAALRARVQALQATYPGLELRDAGDGWRVHIPDRYRTTHEMHFAEVTRQFLDYLRHTESLPAWEKANMLAKYSVTTHGVAAPRR